MGRVAWWQTSVLYEILVPSFQDSDGDGWGDLRGITQRLEYLVDLGIGALWLSPFYKSTLFDIGYDVSDYRAVDPRFGSMEDFHVLLNSAHDRGLRVVVDYVPNHTCNQHPWFQQSRRSRSNSYRDWYLWADARPGGGPPNNWLNRFGRSGWTLDEATGQYYFGTFTPEQPDLNWRNPDVRRELTNVLRYWLELGVDGVRVDALPHLLKDRYLRDNPKNQSYHEDQDPTDRQIRAYSQNQPDLLEVLALLRQVVDEYPDRVLIGEAYQSPEQMATYQRAGVHLLLNTSMLQVSFEPLPLRHMIDYLEAITPVGCWPSRSSGNHDIPRLADRVGQVNLRLAALLQFAVRGAAAMYYGEELGLRQVEVPPDKMRDPSGRDNPRYGRDKYRAPMPWDRSPQGGFSTGELWLPTDAATLERNVADQLADPYSLLNFYRRVLQLRAAEPDLQVGDYRPLDVPEPLLAFRRGDPQQGLVVAMNLSDTPAQLELPETSGEILLSSTGRNTPSKFQSQVDLDPREGIIARPVS